MLDVASEEATEDIQKLGGSEALDEPYTTIALTKMVKKRASWLVVLFLGEMLTATAMSYFRGRAGQGHRALAVHSARHQFGRQRRLAGGDAGHPRPGARGCSSCAIGGGSCAANWPPA